MTTYGHRNIVTEIEINQQNKYCTWWVFKKPKTIKHKTYRWQFNAIAIQGYVVNYFFHRNLKSVFITKDRLQSSYEHLASSYLCPLSLRVWSSGLRDGRRWNRQWLGAFILINKSFSDQSIKVWISQSCLEKPYRNDLKESNNLLFQVIGWKRSPCWYSIREAVQTQWLKIVTAPVACPDHVTVLVKISVDYIL